MSRRTAFMAPGRQLTRYGHTSLPFLVAALAAAVVGLTFAGWRCVEADRRLRVDMLAALRSVAEPVGGVTLGGLSGTRADEERPVYRRLKRELALARQGLKDCRLVYLLGLRPDGQIFFYADSEPAGSAHESFPGQIYYDVAPALREALKTKTPRIEGPLADRRGTSVSGLSPILDPRTNELVAALGIDVDARVWKWQVARAGVVPLLTTGVLTASLLGYGRVRRRLGSSPRLEVLPIAVCCSILTLFAAWLADGGEARRHQDAFASLATDRMRNVAQVMHQLEHFQLEGFSRYLEGIPDLSDAKFHEYADFLAHNTFVQAWEWIPAVPATGLEGFEADARQQGLTGYSVWQKSDKNNRVPVEQRGMYYPVRCVAPLAGNALAIGYDLGSNPDRRAAMEEASRTGLTTATEPVVLVQETEAQNGILVFRPVHSSTEPRRLRGFGLAVLRLGSVLTQSAGVQSEPACGTIALELRQLHPGRPDTVLAISCKKHTHENSAASYVGGGHAIEARRLLFAFGKTFAICAHPGSTFTTDYPRRAAGYTLGIGAVLTVAIALSTSLLIHRRAVLELEVKARTAELQQSELKFRTLFDESGDACFLVDATGMIVDYNKAARSMLRAGPQGVNGHRITEFAPALQPDGKPTKLVAKDRIADALASGSTRFEFVYQPNDGEERWADVLLTDLSRYGQAGLLMTGHDITDRKASDEVSLRRQRASEIIAAVACSPHLAEGALPELASDLTEAASGVLAVQRVGVWLFDATGQRLVNLDTYDLRDGMHVSGAVLEEHEFRHEFAVLKREKYVDAHDAFTDPRTAGYVEGYLKPNRIMSMLDAVIRCEGRSMGTLCFEHVGVQHHWHEDEITFACQLADQVALALSNRERRRVERSQRESEERLRVSVNVAELGLWEWDIDREKLICNERWTEILGYEPSDVGVDFGAWQAIVHPEDLDSLRASVMAHLDGRTPHVQAEHRVKAKDGGWRWVLSTGCVLDRDRQGLPKRAVAAILDITERKQHEMRTSRLSRLRDITSRILGTFIDSEDLSSSINLILAEVGQYFDVSRAYLFRYRDGMEWMFNTHEWCAAGIAPQRELLQLLPAKEFEWWNEELLARRAICLSDLERESIPAATYEFLAAQNIRALLVLPVFIRGELSAFIGFDETRRARHWYEEEIALLQTIVEGFARAVERRISQREREAVGLRMSLAADAASLGVWEYEIGSNRLAWDDWMLRLHGIVRESFDGNMEAWRARIHPDDRPRIEGELDAVLGGEGGFETECRIITAAGDTRIIGISGTVVRNKKGQPVRVIGTALDITAKKQIEAALLESETKFRTFFQTMSDMMFVCASDGTILVTNDAVTRALAYTPDELRTMRIFQLHPPEMHAQAERVFSLMLRGENGVCTLPLVGKDGRLVAVETRVWSGHWGAINCIFGCSRNLTAEIEAQQRFEHLFRHNPAWMFLTTLPDHRCIDVNDAALAALGHTKEEISGRTYEELGVLVDPDAQAWQTQRLQSDGRFEGVELQVRCKDGNTRNGLFSGEVIQIQGRQYLLMVMIDITERKQAERQLNRERQRLAQIIEGTNVGTWEWNVQTGETTFNDRWAEIVGYTLAELSPVSIKTWLGLVHPEDSRDSEQLLTRHFAGDLAYYDCECRMRHKCGTWVWVHDRGRVVEWDDNGKPLRMTGTHSDITARRQTANKLEYRSRQLEDANKALRTSNEEVEAQRQELRAITITATEARQRATMASQAKTEFLARMSHEIRTPLTAIIGYTDLLKRSMHLLPDTCRDWVQSARRSADHLAVLISDILDVSRIEAGRMNLYREPCDVNALLSDLRALMAPLAADKGLRFEVVGEGRIPQVIHADKLRLRQILVNIVGNAIKFTDKGRITVRVSSGESAGRAIMQCAVEDTGIGIPLESRERVFEPFVQGHPQASRGGTGLGLDISQRLARMHGGELTVESEEGRGSTFYLRIPVGCETNHMTPGDDLGRLPVGESHSGGGRQVLNGLRVLIVDDNTDNQSIIRFILEEQGADISVADNGETGVKAVQAAADGGQGYHVVLMDMLMPVMDGYTATRLLRDRGICLPIIAVTAHAMREDQDRCLAAGCTGYLAKPIVPETLIEEIRTACGQSRPPAPAEAGRRASETPGNPRFAEIRSKYVARFPDLIGELQTARRECDRDRLRITAHQLHGTAANYGFPEVSEIASTYEQAMREERGFPECDDVLDRLVDMLRACGSKAAGGSKTSVDALG